VVIFKALKCKPYKKIIYKFNEVNWDEFNNDFSTCELGQLNLFDENNIINDIYALLVNKINSLTNLYIPNKKL